MALPGLMLEQAAPVSVPLRFLLTAPWFALLAALLVLWHGPDAFASRWTPALLGATHLLTLGFMTMVMVGALLQMLPVLGGAPVRRPGLVAGIVHPGLTLGALLLAGGLAFGIPAAIRVAMPLLAVSFLVFLVAAVQSLLAGRLRDPALRTIALALAALAVTIPLGLTLGCALGWDVSLRLIELTALHAGWGLLGWTVLLVAGVAQQVVPMFQATPLYPRFVGAGLGPLMIALLTAWSAAAWLDLRAWAAVLAWLIAVAVASFAVATLWLQRRSRRPQRDPTFLFWRFGLVSLIAAVAVWVAAQALQWSGHLALPLALGVLTIIGFALSVISGMLYKIVPFLLWLNLQMRVGGRPPHIKQILPDQRGHIQLWLHGAATVTLVGAAIWRNWLTYPGAALLAASALVLGVSLWRAWRFARRALSGTQPLPPPSGPRRRNWKRLDP
jgi:hypothetical protein